MEDDAAVRIGVLAMSVLYDVDLTPRDDGVRLDGPAGLEVSWAECRCALAGADPESRLGRDRLAAWLRLRQEITGRSPAQLRAAARPVGLPVGHLLHPGQAWVRTQVPGGALDLGLGLLGPDAAGPAPVSVVAPALLAAAGIDDAEWWDCAARYLARMGTIAAERLRRTSVLRPMGDCDAVTLLGAATLRRALAAGAQGMVAVAVPMRSRGWLDLSRIDPAFAMAAAAATAPAERGFDTALLVTADEVVQVRRGGRPAQLVLRDPAVPRRCLRGVRYR